MTTEQAEAHDALVVTTVDGPTYGAYTRAATALGASLPALLRHVLGGVAPTLAEAATRIADTPAATGRSEGLQLATTLLCGDVLVGEHTRCALTPRAVRAHEDAVATIGRTADLLEQARRTYALAGTVLAETQGTRLHHPAPR